MCAAAARPKRCGMRCRWCPPEGGNSPPPGDVLDGGLDLGPGADPLQKIADGSKFICVHKPHMIWICTWCIVPDGQGHLLYSNIAVHKCCGYCRTEPPRFWRRPHSLREWDHHGQAGIARICSGGPRPSGADGGRTRRRARFAVGSVGDSDDTALAETINGLDKTKVIRRRGPVAQSGSR